jgi:putative endonuclease
VTGCFVPQHDKRRGICDGMLVPQHDKKERNMMTGCFVPQHDNRERNMMMGCFVPQHDKRIKAKNRIMNNTMIEYNEGHHTYCVYIITNKYRSIYYIGMTNNLGIRLQQHKENIEKGIKTFASKYKLAFLVYYEKFTWVQEAIAREKELKGWRKGRKLDLIRSFNENFEFLNYRFVKEESSTDSCHSDGGGIP